MFKIILFSIILTLLIISLTIKPRVNKEHFINKPKLVDGTYAILSIGTRKYCADERWRVICNRNRVGPWERFKIKNINKDIFLIYGGYSKHKNICRLDYKSYYGNGTYHMKCDWTSTPRYNDTKWKITNNNGISNISSLELPNVKCKSDNNGLNCNQSPNNMFANLKKGFIFVLLEKDNETNTFLYKQTMGIHNRGGPPPVQVAGEPSRVRFLVTLFMKKRQ